MNLQLLSVQAMWVCLQFNVLSENIFRSSWSSKFCCFLVYSIQMSIHRLFCDLSKETCIPWYMFSWRIKRSHSRVHRSNCWLVESAFAALADTLGRQEPQSWGQLWKHGVHLKTSFLSSSCRRMARIVKSWSNQSLQNNKEHGRAYDDDWTHIQM